MSTISPQARQELVAAVTERYQRSTPAERGRILDEFVALTGYHRKHAIRVLNGNSAMPAERRGRRSVYDEAVTEGLVVLWEASDRVCGKRLKALLPTLVPALERHGHVTLDPRVREQLMAVSAATIDRRLASARAVTAGRSTTIIFAGCRGRDRPVRGPTQSRVRLPVFLVEDGLVTDAQVRRLREKRMSGKTLAAAAAAAGMSERTARQWQSGPLPSTAKAPRTWRTREDPFAEVWESEVVPQLVADTDGRLQVLTLFKALCRRHPGRFQEGQLRTLQRRVRDWRVQYGADREVYFEQVAVPGREAAFDFTDASDLRVTIRGVPFAHLLFEWVLSYSKWTYVGLALSETFEALVAGLQGALWMLGAVPALLRHDNLSAATHELKRSGGRQLTARFQQVRSSSTTVGVAFSASEGSPRPISFLAATVMVYSVPFIRPSNVYSIITPIFMVSLGPSFGSIVNS